MPAISYIGPAPESALGQPRGPGFGCHLGQPRANSDHPRVCLGRSSDPRGTSTSVGGWSTMNDPYALRTSRCQRCLRGSYSNPRVPRGSLAQRRAATACNGRRVSAGRTRGPASGSVSTVFVQWTESQGHLSGQYQAAYIAD